MLEFLGTDSSIGMKLPFFGLSFSCCEADTLGLVSTLHKYLNPQVLVLTCDSIKLCRADLKQCYCQKPIIMLRPRSGRGFR